MELLRREAMQTIAQSGGTIKYGHTEVGFVSGEYQDMEQHEIEFTPVPLEDREIYEADGVFSPVLIDGVADMLKSYDDKDLSERLYGKDDEIEKLVEEYLHCS